MATAENISPTLPKGQLSNLLKKSPGKHGEESQGSIQNKLEEAERQLDEKKAEIRLRSTNFNQEIENLDDKLNDVLAQQEFEYLKAYNIYVKRKEKDLRDMIEKLNLKNSNNTLKDEKINMLEKIIQSYRDDQVRIEREREQKN